MRKHIIMNFINPRAIDGEKPYRVDCGFKLYKGLLLDVYQCPIIKEMQNQMIDNCITNHSGNEVFVFEKPENSKQMFNKTLFKKNM